MKKYTKYAVISFISITFFLPAVFVYAQVESAANRCPTGQTEIPGGIGGPICVKKTCPSGQFLTDGECEVKNTNAKGYQLLAPITTSNGEGTGDYFNPADDNALGRYLNIMLKVFIGICAVLAVIMIIMGGIEYMTSELAHTKAAGKEQVTNALLGLFIALGAYTLLYTINPDLLKTDIVINKTTIEYLGGESNDPFKPIDQGALQAIGITCDKSGGKPAVVSIGQQFMGKTIYSQKSGERNTVNSSKITLDCSAFVAQVYNCAGLSYPGGNTNEIFGNEAVAVDGATFDYSQLHPGDLVGWKPSDDPAGNGHVAIYIGNGSILDTQSSSNATAIRPLESIKNRIKFVKWPK